MNQPADPGDRASGNELAQRVGRLIQEKGWNQEDFARIAKLNRHTVRQILNAGPERRLRNATVSQCAEAFGLTVTELRTLPLETLLLRLHGRGAGDGEALRRLTDGAELPELLAWVERNPLRIASLVTEDVEELLAMQSPGGVLQRLGVEYAIGRIERRRDLLEKVQEIASSEALDFLEQFVNLLHDKIRESASILPNRGE